MKAFVGPAESNLCSLCLLAKTFGVIFCNGFRIFPRNLAPNFGQYTCERPKMASQND